jgi:hypothetical protein
MAKEYNVVCSECGKHFKASRTDAKACSPKCRKRLYAKKNGAKFIGYRYLHASVKLAKKEGLNWVRMETIRNMSAVLFKTPGSVPETFSTNKFTFTRDNTERFFERYKFAELRRSATRHRVRSTDKRK